MIAQEKCHACDCNRGDGGQHPAPYSVTDKPAYCTPNDWIRRHLGTFSCVDFPAGARVIDVGCGWGMDLEKLRERGCVARGFDIDTDGIAYCKRLGFDVDIAIAEKLPVPDASADGIVCNGVLVFTQEHDAVSEMLRVLRPGGTARLCTQGAGYPLHLLESGPGLKRRFFALRMMVNGLLRNTIGITLPGWMGNIRWHSPSLLRAMLERRGFVVEEMTLAPRHRGLPTFFSAVLRKP